MDVSDKHFEKNCFDELEQAQEKVSVLLPEESRCLLLFLKKMITFGQLFKRI